MRLRHFVLLAAVCLSIPASAEAGAFTLPWLFDIHLEADSRGVVTEMLVDVYSGGVSVIDSPSIGDGDVYLQRGIGPLDPVNMPLQLALADTRSLDITLQGHGLDFTLSQLSIGPWPTIPADVTIQAINLIVTMTNVYSVVGDLAFTHHVMDGVLEMWIEGASWESLPLQPGQIPISTPPISTPEPGTLALLTMGCVAALTNGRRQRAHLMRIRSLPGSDDAAAGSNPFVAR